MSVVIRDVASAAGSPADGRRASAIRVVAVAFLSLLASKSMAQPGSVDLGFNSAINTPYDPRLLPAGKIFLSVARPANYLARLESDGVQDPAFVATIGTYSATASALLVQLDGKVIIGGDFTTVNGATKDGLARLNTDGSLHSPFGGAQVMFTTLRCKGTESSS